MMFIHILPGLCHQTKQVGLLILKRVERICFLIYISGKLTIFLIVHQFGLYVSRKLDIDPRKEWVDHCSKEVGVLTSSKRKRQRPSFMSAILKEATMIPVPKLGEYKGPCYSSDSFLLSRGQESEKEGKKAEKFPMNTFKQ